MKPMATISGREAVIRLAVVVVAEVLLIATMFGLFGEAPSLALDVVVIVSFVAWVAGIFIVVSWAFAPWIARRTECRFWEGRLRLDQADMLRRRGLDKLSATAFSRDYRGAWDYSRADDGNLTRVGLPGHAALDRLTPLT